MLGSSTTPYSVLDLEDYLPLKWPSLTLQEIFDDTFRVRNHEANQFINNSLMFAFSHTLPVEKPFAVRKTVALSGLSSNIFIKIGIRDIFTKFASIYFELSCVYNIKL